MISKSNLVTTSSCVNSVFCNKPKKLINESITVKITGHQHLPTLSENRNDCFRWSYTTPRLSASACDMISPQYSLMSSFFEHWSLMKQPHPASRPKSLGAINRCLWALSWMAMFEQPLARLYGSRSSPMALAGIADSHTLQISGSHSREALKHGHALVWHWALHLQPGKRYGQSNEHRQYFSHRWPCL